MSLLKNSDENILRDKKSNKKFMGTKTKNLYIYKV